MRLIPEHWHEQLSAIVIALLHWVRTSKIQQQEIMSPFLVIPGAPAIRRYHACAGNVLVETETNGPERSYLIQAWNDEHKLYLKRTGDEWSFWTNEFPPDEWQPVQDEQDIHNIRAFAVTKILPNIAIPTHTH